MHAAKRQLYEDSRRVLSLPSAQPLALLRQTPISIRSDGMLPSLVSRGPHRVHARVHTLGSTLSGRNARLSGLCQKTSVHVAQRRDLSKKVKGRHMTS